MKGLTILKPLVVTDAMLVSSTVPETDAPAYASGTTYTAGQLVMLNHVVYQSLQNANTNHNPEAADSTWWVATGATNRWKLFDLSSSSKTAQTTSMVYAVRPGEVVTAVAVVDMVDVETIQVQAVSDVYGEVFNETIERYRIQPESTWWSWFFGQRTEALASYYINLPSFLDAVITVTFTGGADMAVGTLMLGTTAEIGKCVNAGVSLRIKDYSRKQTNDFGDVVLIKRRFSKQVEVPLTLDTAQVDALFNYVAELRATPALWLVSDEFTSTTVFGYYSDFKVLIQYRDLSECSLSLESLA